MRPKLLKSLLAVLILIGIVFIATKYAPSAKMQIAKLFHMPAVSVKGASTELPSAMKKDLENQAGDLKNKALHVNISDVIGFFGRTKKIIDDVKNVGSAAGEQIHKFTTHK